MKSFSRYLVEGKSAITFSFGRLNPPTIGHGKLLDKMKSVSGPNQYRMYLSQSHDPKKNPLSYRDKVKWARKMFAKHGRSIIYDPKLINVFDIATKLHNEGFTDITMVVGSDRIREFNILLNKYNNVKGRHGFYNFKSINVVSAGERDPDAEGVTGMSASKMRAAAGDNDFSSFSKGIPSEISLKDSKKMFNDVRLGMGLKESTNYRNHVRLDKVSDAREQYIKGDLYLPGDLVEDKDGNEYVVSYCGANYLIVEDAKGNQSRKWLNDVSIIEEKTDRWYKNKPEWGTPEASKKARKLTPGQEKRDIVETRGKFYYAKLRSQKNREKVEKVLGARKNLIGKNQSAERDDRELDNARINDFREKLKRRIDPSA